MNDLLVFEPRLTPEGYAREVLHRLRYDKTRVDVIELINLLGIKYMEKDFGTRKIDGGLIRKEDGRAVIYVNSAIPYKGRKNFTAAHELGHFIIKGHDSESYSCSPLDTASYGSSDRKAEVEANKFAAELMMPEKKMNQILKKAVFSMKTVEEIADTFEVSLTAAARRVVQFSQEKCAISIAQNSRILWSYSSPSLKYTVRNGKLHEHSYAFDYFNPAEKLPPNQFVKVVPNSWLSDPGIPFNLDIREHTRYFEDLEMALTLLWLPFNEEEDEFSED